MAAFDQLINPDLAPRRMSTVDILQVEEAEERTGLIKKIQKTWQSDFSTLTERPKEFKPLHPIIIATLLAMDIRDPETHRRVRRHRCILEAFAYRPVFHQDL